MFLKKLYKYIDDKIVESKDDNLIFALQNVVSLLATSDDGKNPEPAQLALLYLYKLPIIQVGILLDSEKKFGTLLQEEGKPTFPIDAQSLKKMNDDSFPMPEQPLAPAAKLVLDEIAVALMTLARTPLWTYHYPLDDDQIGSIKYRSIKGWQSPPTAEVQAVIEQTLRDFLRNFMIAGKHPANLEEFDEALKELAAGASAYKTADLALLISWLKLKGGQSILSFLHELFIQGDFSSSDKYETITKASEALHVPLIPEEIKTVEANWHLEDGSIVFDGEMVINRVFFRNQAIYLYANEKAKIDFFTNPEFNLEESSKLIAPSLMRVKVKIKLAIDGVDNIVLPKITSLDFINYAEQLSSPERLLSHRLTLKNFPGRR